jgi:hypothetical protein
LRISHILSQPAVLSLGKMEAYESLKEENYKCEKAYGLMHCKFRFTTMTKNDENRKLFATNVYLCSVLNKLINILMITLM